MNKPEIIGSDLEKFLSKFHRYNEMMENFLVHEFVQKRQNVNIKELTEKLDLDDDKQRDEFFAISREFSEQAIFYPQSFRTSFLTQIFTVLEHNLIDFCEYHHHTCNSNFSVKDLKGSSEIDKCKLYLKKACKIDFKNLNPEWSFIENTRKIRNLIVHQKGQITGNHRHWNSIFQFICSNKKIIGFSQCIEYMEKSEFAEFHENDIIYDIEISPRTLNSEFLKTIKMFFTKLNNEIKFG